MGLTRLLLRRLAREMESPMTPQRQRLGINSLDDEVDVTLPERRFDGQMKHLPTDSA